MKTIKYIILIALFAVGCTNEDNETVCDCKITTASYNEAMQVYEPISVEPYSTTCQDASPFYNPDGKGNYFMIQCR